MTVPRRPESPPSGASNDQPKRTTAFRPEVQGLRALAVLMVVTYHIWFDRVSGGVDVFLLISAFLMTLSFVRKAEGGLPFRLIRHWIHLFKRLLPAVVVVLLGTIAATLVFLPKTRWSAILDQAWASLFYIQNWFLAAASVDYYADTSVASPLQHFWSLSIQGQVFVLWPILFTAAALIANALKKPFITICVVLFGALFALSLAFSIYETSTNQTYAYFDTRARLWEFALGTLLALALPRLRMKRAIAVMAGWLGLLAMLSVGYVLNVEGQFPGFVALWPLLGAALVISAGQTGSRIGADRVLSWKPLVAMGDISYALYLWHWPILVIYLAYRGRDVVGPLGGLAIIALSLLLAYLTTRFVERPLRSRPALDRSPLRGVVVVAVCLSLVSLPVGGLQQVMRIQAQALAANADTENPGAYSLMEGFVDRSMRDAPPIPDLGDLAGEWGVLSEKCEGENLPQGNDLVQRGCSFISADSEPAKTILVIGDSHAEQWLEPIELMAERNNYQVTALLHGGCSYGATSETRSAGCNAFNEAATAHAFATRPDVVFTMATISSKVDNAEIAVPELDAVSESLAEAGIGLIAIRDNPRFSFNMMTCIIDNPDDVDSCGVPLDQKLAATAPPLSTKQSNGAPRLMDLTDLICPEGMCSPVIGNVYVYLDDNHLTTTYTASTLPEFERRFQALVD